MLASGDDADVDLRLLPGREMGFRQSNVGSATLAEIRQVLALILDID